MSEVNFDLLDTSIDELADLKGFEPIPAGSHRLQISWDKKAINDVPSVILKLKVMETLEMANSNEEEPEVGKEADIAFMMLTKDGEVNEISQGQLKEVLKVLREAVGGDTPNEIMEASDGAEVCATLKIRANKNDPDQKFNQIRKVWIA
tara:strand:- start:423 stop:869 length:447 start_codon:yes stop_codon:yes gene_type:complete